MANILVVEDEANLSRFIELELIHEGYTVTVINDGAEAYNIATEKRFDLILLDLMLPGMNGLEFCRRIRSRSMVPIIMISAKDDLMDKVSGLDTGANDYITKPFAIEELLARVRSLLRSSKAASRQMASNELTINGLTVNSATYQASYNDNYISLTKKEFLLLRHMMENKNIVLSRERLVKEVWKENVHDDSNVVDVFIRYLRNKLRATGCPDMITTVRGIGYVIRED